MYTTIGEAGLSSPAVVNDVVFMSTNRPLDFASTSRRALYAFDATSGLCLWAAPRIPSVSTGSRAGKIWPEIRRGDVDLRKGPAR
jgi:hypothetical protein